MVHWMMVLYATLAFGSGADLGQMREFIRRACRELGLPTSAISQDLARQIHDSLGPIKPRGGTVTYTDVLSEVQARESSFRPGRATRGRRGLPRGARVAGIATVAVVVIDSAVRGEAPGMQDLAETALTMVPVVGPVVATYLIAQPIVEHYTAEALRALSELERARRLEDRTRWQLVHAMAERIMLDYNRDNRYPWQGNLSSGPEGERWRAVASINYARLHYCMNALMETLNSRILTHHGRESTRQTMDHGVANTFDPCVHNVGEFESTDPALRTFQPREIRIEAGLRPHAGFPGAQVAPTH